MPATLIDVPTETVGISETVTAGSAVTVALTAGIAVTVALTDPETGAGSIGARSVTYDPVLFRIRMSAGSPIGSVHSHDRIDAVSVLE